MYCVCANPSERNDQKTKKSKVPPQHNIPICHPSQLERTCSQDRRAKKQQKNRFCNENRQLHLFTYLEINPNSFLSEFNAAHGPVNYIFKPNLRLPPPPHILHSYSVGDKSPLTSPFTNHLVPNLFTIHRPKLAIFSHDTRNTYTYVH